MYKDKKKGTFDKKRMTFVFENVWQPIAHKLLNDICSVIRKTKRKHLQRVSSI